MPRTARLDAPGVLHHVMIRGVERRKIFRNDKDREDFIERLENLCPETQTVVMRGLLCLITPYVELNIMRVMCSSLLLC